MIGFALAYDHVLPRLLDALDRQIAMLRARQDQMKRLFDIIIDRNDVAMEKILEEMERSQQEQADADADLFAVKSELAEAMGRPERELTLTALAEILPEPEAHEVRWRQRELRELAEVMRRQHMETSYLLSECARINRMILECICGQSANTYGSDGVMRWNPAGGVMNTEL